MFMLLVVVILTSLASIELFNHLKNALLFARSAPDAQIILLGEAQLVEKIVSEVKHIPAEKLIDDMLYCDKIACILTQERAEKLTQLPMLGWHDGKNETRRIMKILENESGYYFLEKMATFCELNPTGKNCEILIRATLQFREKKSQIVVSREIFFPNNQMIAVEINTKLSSWVDMAG